MSKRSRDKGLLGEREVRHAFEHAGFPVRGLEATGDHLIVCGAGLTLHVEVKRAEALRMSDWSKQAEGEAPQGTVPILAYRRSREPWRVSLRLDDLIALLIEPDRLHKLIVEHHAHGALEDVAPGDPCPVCSKLGDVPVSDIDAALRWRAERGR